MEVQISELPLPTSLPSSGKMEATCIPAMLGATKTKQDSKCVSAQHTAWDNARQVALVIVQLVGVCKSHRLRSHLSSCCIFNQLLRGIWGAIPAVLLASPPPSD